MTARVKALHAAHGNKFSSELQHR